MGEQEERAKRFDLHAEVDPKTVWDELSVDQKLSLANVGISENTSLEAITAAAYVADTIVIDLRNTFGGSTTYAENLSKTLTLFSAGRAEDKAFDHSIIKDDSPEHIGPAGIELEDVELEGR